jgi:hypothetical protein
MFSRNRKIIVWPLGLLFFIGLAVSGQGQILCIGGDGHIEFELYCLPCCGEVEETCQIEPPDDLHNKHSECSGCSDLELDRTLWRNRARIVIVDNLTVSTLLRHAIIQVDQFFEDNSNQIAAIYNLAFSQCPSSLPITTAILRC